MILQPFEVWEAVAFNYQQSVFPQHSTVFYGEWSRVPSNNYVISTFTSIIACEYNRLSLTPRRSNRTSFSWNVLNEGERWEAAAFASYINIKGS